MQDVPFAEWQQYALTAIGHVLIEKGYFESRFAKITLAQKLLHRNIETRLIPLGSHPGRTAFLVSQRLPIDINLRTLITKSSQWLTKRFLSGE